MMVFQAVQEVPAVEGLFGERGGSHTFLSFQYLAVANLS